MVKINDIYQRVNDSITANDLTDLEMPLTIKEVEITGKDKKTIKILLEETSLKFKCSKKEVIDLSKEFKTNDTDDFIGKELILEDVDGKVKVKV